MEVTKRTIDYQNPPEEQLSEIPRESLPAKLSDPSVADAFKSELEGYHLINSAPVKESVWETIAVKVACKMCVVTEEAAGNHVSGKDMSLDSVGMSMKSIKITNATINFSSYRLTTVCSDKTPGDPVEILNEIRKRDASFEYYALLVRREYKSDTHSSMIDYEMYIIPKTADIFKVDETDFAPTIGQRGKKKGTQLGWNAKNLSIVFSMSSQLWIQFKREDIIPYLVCSTTINNSHPKMSYTEMARIVREYNDRI